MGRKRKLVATGEVTDSTGTCRTSSDSVTADDSRSAFLQGEDDLPAEGIVDGSAEEGGEQESLPLQRNAANERERARMRVLSKAFTRLKTSLPWVPPDTKLSKLDTLRLASCYIAHLSQLLAEDDAATAAASAEQQSSLVAAEDTSADQSGVSSSTAVVGEVTAAVRPQLLGLVSAIALVIYFYAFISKKCAVLEL